MATPSDYEIEAWKELQRFKGRPITRVLNNTGEKISSKINDFSSYIEENPKTSSAVLKAKDSLVNSKNAVGKGLKNAVGILPDQLTDWGGHAANSISGSISRASRIGLSPSRIVKLHQKRGHQVEELSDLRKLDLKQIDQVRGRNASWIYPSLASISGVGASFVITGGTFSVPVSGGVAAAPAGAAVAGSFALDAAAVLGVASRAIGQIALQYGYDPENPAEKLYIMSVLNAGTAFSAQAKTAALADVSRLTQSLVRGKAWKVLDASVVTQVSKQFTKAFSLRFTKQSLGKVVPVAGIVAAGTMNWTTIERIYDAANVIYRRRFLLEKYPSLEQVDLLINTQTVVENSDDETISILQSLDAAGGPDLQWLI